MKAKSKEIKSILDDKTYSDSISIKQKISELNFTTSHNEYDIDEALVDFANIRSLILRWLCVNSVFCV